MRDGSASLDGRQSLGLVREEAASLLARGRPGSARGMSKPDNRRPACVLGLVRRALDLPLWGSRRLVVTGHPPGTREPSVGLVSIGEFSRLSRLSPKALRLYDELGLLVPDHVDGATGCR